MLSGGAGDGGGAGEGGGNGKGGGPGGLGRQLHMKLPLWVFGLPLLGPPKRRLPLAISQWQCSPALHPELYCGTHEPELSLRVCRLRDCCCCLLSG